MKATSQKLQWSKMSQIWSLYVQLQLKGTGISHKSSRLWSFSSSKTAQNLNCFSSEYTRGSSTQPVMTVAMSSCSKYHPTAKAPHVCPDQGAGCRNHRDAKIPHQNFQPHGLGSCCGKDLGQVLHVLPEMVPSPDVRVATRGGNDPSKLKELNLSSSTKFHVSKNRV